MRWASIVPAALVTVVLAACSPGATSAPSSTAATPAPSDAATSPAASGGAVELTVFGAASLKGALDKVVTAYQASHPRTSLTISTGSSAALAAQIQQGAPADVFLSADVSNPQKLVEGGFGAGAPRVFARNELTVVVPVGDPAGVRTPADLARPGMRIVAAGDQVPITTYATQLVENLAKQPGYPSGFAAAYAANVVSKEDDVKSIVTKIELGEGDAGIVYVTDAAAPAKVQAVAVPDAANVPATYAGVVTKASKHPEAARAFLDWLAGPDGQAILAGFGFLPPSP